LATPLKDPGAESLADLLGGRSAAIDATLGPIAFVVGYFAIHRSIGWASVIAIAVTALIATWRVWRGDKPRAVVIGLLGVVVGVLIVMRTGHIEDVFIPRIVTNVASLLAFLVSVIVRWPLLGVIVGTLLGQKGRWRHDPDLLRAYSRGSLIWALQYFVRAAVWIPLWAAGATAALTATSLALSYPLIAAAIAGSWWIIQRTLPPGHPGLRHPRPAGEDPAPQEQEAGQGGKQVGPDQNQGLDQAAGQRVEKVQRQKR
jgi:hypothetical protein